MRALSFLALLASAMLGCAGSGATPSMPAQGTVTPAASKTSPAAGSDAAGGKVAASTQRPPTAATLVDAVSVKDFGAVGDGVTDDAPAFSAALTASRHVLVPDPAVAYLLGSEVTVPPDAALVGSSKRATRLLHAHDGDALVLSHGASLENLDLEMQGARYLGRGLVLTGTAGAQRVEHVRVVDCEGPCVYFGVLAGSTSSWIDVEAWRSNGLGTGRYAFVIEDALETSAVPRKFSHVETGGQDAFDFGGADDLFISDSFLGALRYSPSSLGVHITNSRIANAPALVLDGHGHSIVGCNINPVVSIAPGADAVSLSSNVYNKHQGQNVPDVIDASGNNRNYLNVSTFVYTPTLSAEGAAPGIGNGTIAGSYARSGTMVTVSIELAVGTTTSIGSGELRFSLPYTTQAPGSQLGTGYAYHGGFHTFVAETLAGTSYVRAITPDHGVLNHYSPMWWDGTGWQPGDVIRLSITYTL